MDENPTLRIGDVARAAGVRKSLIRYYEQIGLLPEAPRISGQRRYTEAVLRRLSVIDVAQRAGLSLDEIRELLAIGSDPVSPAIAHARRAPAAGDRAADRARRAGSRMAADRDVV